MHSAIDKAIQFQKNGPMLRHVLLTGSTGILGSRTLIELLRDENTHVYCPVRCRENTAPMDRILSAISIYSPSLSPNFVERIHPFVCDLTSDCIASTLSAVIDPERINKVIHSSALTSFMSQLQRTQQFKSKRHFKDG